MNLASLITGHYDFQFIPIALPSSYILSLLPPSLQQNHLTKSSPFLSNEELINLGLKVPSAGEGKNWIVIECGKQINTGMRYIPGGKSDFYEAKLQIPFLRHPLTLSSTSTTVKTSFTYKSTLLFSSLMMSISGSKITGLNTSRANFQLSEGSYEVEGWMSIRTLNERPAGTRGVEGGWSKELVRSCINGWWWGERTGSTATRFSMTSITPPIPQSNLLVRIHLPSFSKEPLDEELDKSTVDGWIEVEVPGWKLNEATTMQAKNVLLV